MCWLSGHPLPEAEFLQASYPERFEREMGCTETEWLRWLPRAMGEHHWKLQTGTAGVRIGDGALGLKWQVAAPRVIGLVQHPGAESELSLCRVGRCATLHLHAAL
jgi:hypothetical protein